MVVTCRGEKKGCKALSKYNVLHYGPEVEVRTPSCGKSMPIQIHLWRIKSYLRKKREVSKW